MSSNSTQVIFAQGGRAVVRAVESDTFCAVAPDGRRLRITRELFAALENFLGPEKPCGSLTVTFRNAGIAGVETLTRTVYK
jgi:hypothetical protein